MLGDCEGCFAHPVKRAPFMHTAAHFAASRFSRAHVLVAQMSHSILKTAVVAACNWCALRPSGPEQ